MVILREMTDAEFPSYRALFIAEYALDLQHSRGYPVQKATDIATHAIDVSLTEGVNTAANSLWCILPEDDENTVIGYFWLVRNTDACWVCDFCLLPAWRGRGFGRVSLAKMEARIVEQQVSEIGLRVAVNNPAAKALYEKSGFQITGFNMIKTIP
ncbi:GNAT family N-acetyltransferase [Enterobacteriaceae bacterium H18W14]|uniref:GNAT family N-acetyltransferase n=1 Tax=Dryocola boscaweniae TaxID=2925397 RepID=UPI0022F0198B|nr:GNAT family N-acetyltransferase [Dryocola boscaweniae]MCT4717011.1 GNAT family N-acetyltransferase [Dryocola boscaweniae]